MATLASYFRESLQNIEPGKDADHARDAHAEVRDVLQQSPDLRDLGINPVLIGSYKRNVSIRRVKDVDVFGRLDDADDTLRPGHALVLFHNALLEGYDKNRVHAQHRSFKVDFPDYDLAVDVVPARKSGNNWEIPKKTDQDNRASWIETNPLKLNDLTTQANADFTLNGKGIYVPTVKLVRQVRRTWLDDQPGGLFLELMTFWAFRNHELAARSQAEYLTLALEHIAAELPNVAADGLDDPTIDGKKIATRATEDDFKVAIKKFDEASKLARDALDDDDDCQAAVLWQRLLGATTEDERVFPTPEYCNADGTRRATATTVKGAGSPAGTGRYA
ncbi:SMODS domain-containing nucleotidyltransferase [Kribbella deserti]|uniref:Nucleotidyltransferase n=1 Tax=Kribbella deserti TaxID=1926257 RepID=A0ABV6QF39_9ACTN